MNTTSGTQAPAVGAIVHVSPATLLIERNIREAAPDAGLIASVKDVGVLEPITAVLNDENDLVVRFGHRRTLAALEAGLDTVPVYVGGRQSDTTDDEVHRVVTQYDENTHRNGLTAAEDVGVVATLAGLGLSAGQITKRSRIARATVDAALTLAASDMAREHTELHDLTLEQGAVLAEFETDPEAVIALVNAAGRGQFDHTVQKLRDARHFKEMEDRLTEELIQQGLVVLDQRPHYEDKTVLSMNRIRTNGKKVDEAAHSACPGHVAWISATWADLGPNNEPVDYPEEPEDDTDTAALAAYDQEVARVRSTVRHCQVPAAEYGCKGWQSHGHTDSYSTTPPRVPAAEMSPAEREEASKARKVVIENNKAWSAAQPVRRDFIAKFAKAKTPPKGTSRFLAEALNLDAALLGSAGGSTLATEWVGGTKAQWGRSHVAIAKSASESRCTVIALVQVLAAHEDGLGPGTWREDGTANAAGRYLRFLAACGYTLSDVEQYAITSQTA